LVYLYNITSESLVNKAVVNEFIESVNLFLQIISANQSVCIYIRYNENSEENQIFCEQLFNTLINMERVTVTKYVLNKQIHGMWGNEREYPKLYESMNIDIKKTFPKIFIK
jgi:hypothetical protein